MTKQELFKSVEINVRTGTVFIQNKHINFMYNGLDIIKPEFRAEYRYFGGLQCGYEQGTSEFARIEKWCCELAESILKVI